MLQFKYQKFWLRVFSLIPVWMVLSFLEYKFFSILRIAIKDWQFFSVSIIIMYLMCLSFFKYTGKCFTRNAVFNVDSMEICLKKKHIINLKNTQEVYIDKMEIYGVQIAVLSIKYKNRYRKIYSEDLKHENIEESELWKVYNNFRENSVSSEREK